MDVFLISSGGGVIVDIVSVNDLSSAQQSYLEYVCVEITPDLIQFGLGDRYNGVNFTKTIVEPAPAPPPTPLGSGYVFLIKNGVIENCICAENVDRAQMFYPDYTCIERIDTNSQFGLNDLYDGVNFTKAAPPPAVFVPISRLDFLRKFTVQQRIAIRQSTDLLILDAVHMMDLAEQIELDDPDTIYFVNYLATQSFITIEDANRILGVV